jgi:bacterioferritin
MGKKGKEIVGLDVEDLVNSLNQALANEWQSFYQYWLAAHVVTGEGALGLSEQLRKIALQELDHADELAKRILQLGGMPLTNPREWAATASCAYVEPPENPADLRQIIKDGADAEVCAIEFYNELANKVFNKDSVTYQAVVRLLAQEVEQEETFDDMLPR